MLMSKHTSKGWELDLQMGPLSSQWWWTFLTGLQNLNAAKKAQTRLFRQTIDVSRKLRAKTAQRKGNEPQGHQ